MRVDPSIQEVWKFLPSNPPRRGEIVLVDNVRCVVRRCKVKWEGRQWTIIDLRVKVLR